MYFVIKVFLSLIFLQQSQSDQITEKGHESCTGEMRNINKVLVEKSEENRPLWRPRHKWEDKIQMHSNK
jgi:hypothetical protein